MIKRLISVIVFLAINTYAQQVDWSESAKLPGDGVWSIENRANIYGLPDGLWHSQIEAGTIHSLVYPVTATGILLPYDSLNRFFKSETNSPIRKFVFKIAKDLGSMKSWESFFAYGGILSYPKTAQENYSNIPTHMTEAKMGMGMGSSFIKRGEATGVTFGCAACHSADLFGKKVLGLTNRFPEANKMFVTAKKLTPFLMPGDFKLILGSSDADTALYQEVRDNMHYIGAISPIVLGLDTSLAQVGVSLHKRAKDEYATKKPRWLKTVHPLEKIPADSKPAVWWNLKYKTRWLSDGSIVQGNPVHTNFLWNEIGRGADLKKLETWMIENEDVIEELTTSVFATNAPRYEDFFEKINIESAKRGEGLFNNNCMSCHGSYEKAWTSKNANILSPKELIQTVNVSYHAKTPVIDVGTDPYRHEGMKYFAEDLNRLKISKTMQTVVKPQVGYVPPPLVGIWARWPYFHNNSIPNLCALLTPASARPKTFWMGEAKNPTTDFDEDCNGYPLGDKVPSNWKTDKKFFFNTEIKGLSNSGHDKMLLDANGREKFSAQDKLDLIQFLKTL